MERRRTPAALERVARQHEPRWTAAVAPGLPRPLHARAVTPSRGQTRHHRLGPGQRPQCYFLGTEAGPRCVVREKSRLHARFEDPRDDGRTGIPAPGDFCGRPRDHAGIPRHSRVGERARWVRKPMTRPASHSEHCNSRRGSSESRTMRVLMLCTKYPLDPKDRYMTNELAGALVAAGHRVQVVVTDWNARLGSPATSMCFEGVDALVISPRAVTWLGRFIERA